MANVFNQAAGGNPTQGEMAANLQYGGDPRSAMVNAILNMGGNPFKSNPFMKMLLATAPGLQAVQMLSNIGAKPDDIGGEGGMGQMFGNFLKSSIGGGNVFGQLRGAASQLPQYANQLRDYQGAVKGDENMAISPFAAALEELFNDPQGLTRLMTSLQAPGLGSLARPWAGALEDRMAATTNRYANEFAGGKAGSVEDPANFFDYVFGRG